MDLERFQMIDKVVELVLDAPMIRVEARIPTSSTIFEGHFPGHPLMPGVLLIETMAQTAGWHIIGVTGFARMPFLAAVRKRNCGTSSLPDKCCRCEQACCMTVPATR